MISILLIVGGSSVTYAKKKPKKSKIERISKQDVFYQWMCDNLKCPDVIYEEGIQGTMLVRIHINHNGEVDKSMIIKRLHKSLDSVVSDLIITMPKFDTLYYKSGYYTFPIHIRL